MESKESRNIKRVDTGSEKRRGEGRRGDRNPDKIRPTIIERLMKNVPKWQKWGFKTNDKMGCLGIQNKWQNGVFSTSEHFWLFSWSCLIFFEGHDSLHSGPGTCFIHTLGGFITEDQRWTICYSTRSFIPLPLFIRSHHRLSCPARPFPRNFPSTDYRAMFVPSLVIFLSLHELSQRHIMYFHVWTTNVNRDMIYFSFLQ